MLRDRMGLAVALSNDAHISALGEYTFGSAHGMKCFIIVCLGIGIGSCFFSEGDEHRGHLGFAGEFGHTCVVDNGRKCGCGHNGCLEAESDAPSLMRDIENLSPRIIAELCDKGDEMAIETFRRTGYYLGLGLANYASIVDPEAIILTGGISHAAFEPHVFGNLRGKVKILCSNMNNRERDVLGASALAWSVPEYSLFK